MSTPRLHALCLDAADPAALAAFWSELLGLAPDPREDAALLPQEETGFRLRFLPSTAARTGPNQMHFDLTTTSLEDQADMVARALALGGRHHDVGQRGDEGHVVLADPEGNEFCVVEPGNSFLADTGAIGALSSDGSQAVGYFWSAALGWPLVWDQDEETAIQAAHGGTIISWGGPPYAPKRGKNRLHLDLTVPSGDLEGEAGRLVSLGATRLDGEPHGVGEVAMADPDGNEFCLLP